MTKISEKINISNRFIKIYRYFPLFFAENKTQG